MRILHSMTGSVPCLPLFDEGDPTGDPAPKTDPAPDPKVDPAPKADDKGQDNEAAKYRRLHEKAEAELKTLREADEARKKAELSDIDRHKQEAADARKEAETAKQEALRLRLCKDLPDEALEFVTATDEEGIKAQVAKLAPKFTNNSSTGAAAQPAGTITQPPAGTQPTTAEKIAAAEKSGDALGAIRLMREAQGLVKE